ncbi:uncharacterized protein LOC127255775 isoform X2 [Andrographis paniculata]|nr:uncharacterized protein LOC127255775 isoform X2 [Andrographis paniculata]
MSHLWGGRRRLQLLSGLNHRRKRSDYLMAVLDRSQKLVISGLNLGIAQTPTTIAIPSLPCPYSGVLNKYVPVVDVAFQYWETVRTEQPNSVAASVIFPFDGSPLSSHERSIN